MLHFLPELAPESAPTLHPEPVTRLASLRNALRTADEFGGGPAPDLDFGDLGNDDELTARWESAVEAAKRCFDRRSAELVGCAGDAFDVISAGQQVGQPVSEAAMQAIADELRRGLDDLQRVIRDPSTAQLC